MSSPSWVLAPKTGLRIPCLLRSFDRLIYPKYMAGTKLFPLWPVALLFGMFGGWVYLHIPDAVFAALLVLAFSMAMGVARPRRPWGWALLIALCIPAAEGWLIATRVHLTAEKLPGTFVVLAPGFVGAYGGSFMRKAVGVLFQKPGRPQDAEKTKADSSRAKAHSE